MNLKKKSNFKKFVKAKLVDKKYVGLLLARATTNNNLAMILEHHSHRSQYLESNEFELSKNIDDMVLSFKKYCQWLREAESEVARERCKKQMEDSK